MTTLFKITAILLFATSNSFATTLPPLPTDSGLPPLPIAPQAPVATKTKNPTQDAASFLPIATISSKPSVAAPQAAADKAQPPVTTTVPTLPIASKKNLAPTTPSIPSATTNAQETSNGSASFIDTGTTKLPRIEKNPLNPASNSPETNTPAVANTDESKTPATTPIATLPEVAVPTVTSTTKDALKDQAPDASTKVAPPTSQPPNAVAATPVILKPTEVRPQSDNQQEIQKPEAPNKVTIPTQPTSPTSQNLGLEKFINDEVIVFTLADDDVELGKLTEEARVAQMEVGEYIKLFWQYHKTSMEIYRKKDVDIFLSMHETHKASSYDGAMSNESASLQAFDAANKGGISDIRAIISYYPALQMLDERGDTMLHVAIESGNLDAARFLLMRGINMNLINYEGDDVFSIAEYENNDKALSLLRKARGY